MKTGTIITLKAVGILFVLNGFTLLTLRAQGPLTPPGAPGPTMKTLDQLEPRIDLATVTGDASAMHVISAPGSYYLSANLDVTTDNGIEIAASGVTVDLMGFTIFRSSEKDAAGTAIRIEGSGNTNVHIRNGHITGGVTYDDMALGDQFTGPGFSHGIREAASPNVTNTRVSHVHVFGCDRSGIDLSPIQPEVATVVEYCSVRVVGETGIQAGNVVHSQALVCGGAGILARGNVIGCRGQSVSTASSTDGIFALGSAVDSIGETAGDSGIYAAHNVENCFGNSTAGEGIRSDHNVSNSVGVSSGTDSDSHGISCGGSALNCHGSTSGQDGISAGRNVGNSFGHSTGSGDGIDASGSVSNSIGTTSGDDGIDCSRNALNSYGSTTGSGTAADGIVASTAMNCTGISSGDDGIDTTDVVSYSSGNSSGTGDGIESFIAVGCRVAGGESIVNKYLMP